MNKYISGLLLGIVLLLGGCRKDSSKDVAERFANAFHHRDFKIAMSLATKTSRVQLETISQFATGLPEASVKEAQNIKVIMGKGEEKGDRATYFYKTSDNDIEQKINLVKVDGQWLVEWNKMDSPVEENKAEPAPPPSTDSSVQLKIGTPAAFADSSSAR
ncbi:hypothetical protein DBR32_10885 [Taibaiella sp. KBW10]|uniref:DUF4878 domain-containing protein n=1 Tax=Taibaiella sp. KBW10 TaxID=2153357 RepID=UPI000F5AC1F1|nr:DUF4878 domain-containing protein [Taibaiella sp. KBW10]RQO30084.1 hypothetical protein DBR32_10885 [Taibaiella sp. KBW10]